MFGSICLGRYVWVDIVRSMAVAAAENLLADGTRVVEQESHGRVMGGVDVILAGVVGLEDEDVAAGESLA